MNRLIQRFQRLKNRLAQIDELARKIDEIQKAVGRIESRQLFQEYVPPKSLHDYEFKVFSQWGEDGIIQYLLHSIPIREKSFVEFGVQDYRESNTRFLLQNDNWSGLILDGSAEFIESVKKDPLYYRNDLRAVCAFIDRDNINTLLEEHGFTGDIGLLSIDIDGNDYWIWEAITCVQPRIVICEYDSLLGCSRAVTTPYDRKFVRIEAHYSFLYGGASLPALDRLANHKGYSLVGSNSAGNNAFFVRNDLVTKLRKVTPQEAYVKAKFRNSHDESGRLTFLSFDESLQLIRDLPLYDIERDALVKVADILSTK